MSSNGANKDFATVKIDGQEVKVPKGTNIVEAAKSIGIEIPHYCYHPHLSIAGNCRMCQVEVVGAPKLDIACNMLARDGLEVKTQHTSTKVKDAQAATLEFILINHPLDCTVCDQAGHCKLQDYHYEYNARSSRFLEHKEHKVKAEPLGPTVILDGERCIMCTRCIRFCDEITQTSELGMLNRGDRSVIAINQGRELNNPLSGTVVDLCPVGALTHRAWRFNTRIWFTKETDSICPGCSTGCSVKVATRDTQVVQVKARHNAEVNKEWLCDEGRYGFERFLPEARLVQPKHLGKVVSWEHALKASKALLTQETLVFVSPHLMLEEYALLKKLLGQHFKNAKVVLGYRERKLSDVEAVLISPDYAANFRGAEFAGLVSGNLEQNYNEALKALCAGAYKSVLLVGDDAVTRTDQTPDFLTGLRRADQSLAITADARSLLSENATIVFPARSILEQSGLLINRKGRLQYAQAVIDFPEGAESVWRIINRLSHAFGIQLSSAENDRECTLEHLLSDDRLKNLTIAAIKRGGIPLALTGTGVATSAGGQTTEVRA